MAAGLPVSLIVELTLALLLAATLFYCVRLERHLRYLRNDQEHLSDTIRGLNGAILTAQTSLAGLRASAGAADESLGRRIASARALADELSLLNAAAERIATRIETARLPASGRVSPPPRDGFRAAR